MNNHNNGEPRLDENPFDGIIQRALLHQQNGSADATRQRSVGSEYRVTLDHGAIRLGPECGCDLRSNDGVVTKSAKGICQHHHRQCACKDIRHDEQGARS